MVKNMKRIGNKTRQITCEINKNFRACILKRKILIMLLSVLLFSIILVSASNRFNQKPLKLKAKLAVNSQVHDEMFLEWPAEGDLITIGIS